MGVNLHERETAHQPHHTTPHCTTPTTCPSTRMAINQLVGQRTWVSTGMLMCQPTYLVTSIAFKGSLSLPTWVPTYWFVSLHGYQPAWLSNFFCANLKGCQPTWAWDCPCVNMHYYQPSYVSICSRVNLLACQRAYRFQPAGVSTWVGVNPVMCRVIID